MLLSKLNSSIKNSSKIESEIENNFTISPHWATLQKIFKLLSHKMIGAYLGSLTTQVRSIIISIQTPTH